MYHYLTGSASWFILTLLTQVFGVRGYYGDLLLGPKLTKKDFINTTEVSIKTHFADKTIEVIYRNRKKIPYEHTFISKVTLNGRELKELELQKKEVLIKRELFLKYSKKSGNQIVVTLE